LGGHHPDIKSGTCAVGICKDAALPRTVGGTGKRLDKATRKMPLIPVRVHIYTVIKYDTNHMIFVFKIQHYLLKNE